MKFLDDLLAGDHPGPTTPPRDPDRSEIHVEEVSISSVASGDLDFGNSGGAIKDSQGQTVATIKPGFTDPNDFSISVRLVIPKSVWDRVEVVCDGNAVDVETEPAADGRYKVKRTLRGYKPAVFKKEETIELREFETTKQFIEWIETLDTDAVEALRQIYYDRWNFDTASQRDRMYYELLEEEKKGRSK